MGYERQVKLFRNGRNRAVRIPKEFDFLGDEAVMRREGDCLILEPTSTKRDIRILLEEWRKEPPLGPEESLPEADDRPPEPFEL